MTEKINDMIELAGDGNELAVRELVDLELVDVACRQRNQALAALHALRHVLSNEEMMEDILFEHQKDLRQFVLDHVNKHIKKAEG